MLDHLGLTSADLARSKTFFLQALAPLQIGVVMEVTAEQTGAHDHIGFGSDGNNIEAVCHRPADGATA
nr:hypothetical protein [Stenotrophomonas geniculata]